MAWSSVAGFDGQLTWIPENFDAVPADCVCGAGLKVTEVATVDQQPIELTCDRGHRWRGTQQLLQERLAAKVAEAEAGQPRCARCGEFLSAVRVEMRIDRCAKCDGARGKAQR